MRKRDIDKIDIEILNILREDAYTFNKDLADKVGLSPGPTLVRVQNLIAKGVIKGYSAQTNYNYFGYNCKWYVVVKVLAERHHAFTDRVEKCKNATSCYLLKRVGEDMVSTNSYALTLLAKTPAENKEALSWILSDDARSYALSYEIYEAQETVKDTGLMLDSKDVK